MINFWTRYRNAFRHVRLLEEICVKKLSFWHKFNNATTKCLKRQKFVSRIFRCKTFVITMSIIIFWHSTMMTGNFTSENMIIEFLPFSTFNWCHRYTWRRSHITACGPMDRIKVSYVLNYCVYDSPLFAAVCGVMARLATVNTRTTSLGIYPVVQRSYTIVYRLLLTY